MNPIYADAAFFLQDNGFGTLGSDLFGGEWGEKTDKQILCLNGIATPAELKNLYEPQSLQIIVRGDKLGRDLDVYSRAHDIRKFFLCQPENVDMNGTCYKGFEEGSNLAPLGKDDNQRFMYSMNFTTTRNA